MSDSPKIESTRTIAWQAGGSSAHLAERQKMALQQQHELLQGAQQRMAAWIGRRQVALDTSIDALTRMSACKTPVEMAVLCGEWMSGSITRLLADLDDAQAHTVKMAEHFQKVSSTLFGSPQIESPQVAQADPALSAEIRQPVVPEVPSAQHQLHEAA